LAQARQLGVPAYQGYGLTECGSVVSLNRPGDDGDGVGRPLPHVQVVIRDDEIHIASCAFRGYLGDAAARPGADYATGDLGHFDDDGHLHLSGRRKNLLITSFGRNVSPEWVEASLLAQPQIAQAVVAGDSRPALAAVVVPSPGVSRSDVAAAIGRANASLPDYARLAGWVDAAPFTLQNEMLTGNGRPVRSAILDHYAAALAALYNEQSIKETNHAFL
jgi:long-subunit acyl-CoA synthetase (AMP-forming)